MRHHSRDGDGNEDEPDNTPKDYDAEAELRKYYEGKFLKKFEEPPREEEGEDDEPIDRGTTWLDVVTGTIMTIIIIVAFIGAFWITRALWMMAFSE